MTTTTDGREIAAPGGPAHPAGRQMEELSLDVQAKVLAGEVTSEKLASPADSLPLIEPEPGAWEAPAGICERSPGCSGSIGGSEPIEARR